MLNMDDPISANPGHAADLLWKHQLRQEHAAAMKMIQDLENRQSLVQQKFIEMEADLFKMKSELERKIEDDTKQFTELQTQLMNLMQSQFPQVSKEEYERMIQERLRHEKDLETEHISVTQENVEKPTDIPTPVLEPEHTGPLPTNPPNPSRRVSNRPVLTAIKRPSTRQSQRDEVTTSTTASREKLPSASKAQTTTATMKTHPNNGPQPKSVSLSQKHRSMEVYVKHADGLYNSCGDLDRETEISFVNRFIRGINSQKNAKGLIEALEMAFHRSRTNSKGQVEVLCKWEDVKRALVEAGITKNIHKRQKIS
ncbi:hypothetical protein GLAREA_05389 [Glarea lozoyensis ATCC 20868]|uniref:Uncharacterized protein n=1 Tax=Glarea lozoyensis (strain ATCC 20868 / MF5171) TaxID=1116229 RepID=S3DVR2_GLAL2|nr:uncharacterized protein GLAREA_05389 [Glarea lozoyensis ATCC 20868]EPE36051.1 hypothetical protein GLAREA_05389 [Glarea lozoyensis ATCC 20868]